MSPRKIRGGTFSISTLKKYSTSFEPMRKEFLLFLALCISSVVMLSHVVKPAKVSMPSIGGGAKELTVSMAPSVISTDALSHTVVAIVPVLIQHDSNSISVIQPDVTNVPTDILNQTANNDLDDPLRKLRNWAARDAESALAGVMKLPPGDERNQALIAVCHGLAQDDPATAIKLAQTLKLDTQPDAVIPGLVQQWAATDLPSSLDWAYTQPAGGQRDDSMARIAFVLSQTQPMDGINLVQSQIPSGPAQDKAILTVLDQWADQDIDSAIACAIGFPEGPLRQEALNGLEHQRLAAQ